MPLVFCLQRSHITENYEISKENELYKDLRGGRGQGWKARE